MGAGLRRAAGRYLLLLNPDAVLAPDSLSAMVGFMDAHPQVGLATARLVLLLATAIARTVVVDETVIGPTYLCEEVVGVPPLVV